MIRRLTIILIAIMVCSISGFAQSSIDFSRLRNIDISTLSDAQIKQLSKTIQARGLSMQQVKAMGKARGLSDAQLTLLESRLNSIRKTANSQYSEEKQNATATGTAQNIFDPGNATNTTDEDVEVFGYEMFNIENLTFEPNANIPVSDKYILGLSP